MGSRRLRPCSEALEAKTTEDPIRNTSLKRNVMMMMMMLKMMRMTMTMRMVTIMIDLYDYDDDKDDDDDDYHILR